MAPLLSIDQQQSIKAVSPNWAASTKKVGGITNYDQMAIEVEDSKLMPLLGAALLQDVQESPTSATNVILLDGGNFEDCNGNTIKFKGLRYILAYFNFCQYISESYVGDTFTGFVRKDRQETQTLSSSERKALQIEFKNIALQQWDLTRQFLNENTKDYPLWICAKSREPFRPRLSGVRKTIN